MTRQSELRQQIRDIKRYISAAITAIDNQFDKMAYNRHADIDLEELDKKQEELRLKWKEFDDLDSELDHANGIEKSIAINESYIDNLEVVIGMGHKIEKIKQDILELEGQRDAIFKKVEDKIEDYKSKQR